MQNCKTVNDIHIEYLKDLTKDSYAYDPLVNSFSVIETFDHILMIIYATRNNSIISYDIIDNRKIKEIENAHNKPITLFSHCFDNNINKRDLILSVSSFDNNIKLWDTQNWDCLFNTIANNNPWTWSACFLKDNNQVFILTSNWSNANSEQIKVLDCNGNKIKEINDSNDGTFFIDSYYDNKFSKNYILSAHLDYVKSYDYNNNEVYHKYCDNNNKGHSCISINNNKENTILIESSIDGFLRIWDFHSGLLLSKIEIKGQLYDICLFKENYCFVGCDDKTIKFIDMKNKKVVKNLNGHNMGVLTIKKINHPEYGECLLSQGFCEDNIKLWNIKI